MARGSCDPTSSAVHTRRGRPLAWHLVGLCAAVAIPLLLLAGVLLYEGALSERARLEDQARNSARDLAQLLDRDHTGMIATLQALATLPPLQSGDFEAFDRRARDIVRWQGTNIVLRDLTGQQLVNTRLPWGAPLPRSDSRPVRDTDRATVESKHPQVSNYFIGAVAKAPLFLVQVPVFRGDDRNEVAYVLNLSMPVEHLGDLLKEKDLPPGWWATIIDREGVVLARTMSPEMVGKRVVPGALAAMAEPVSGAYLTSPEGIRNFGAFHRSNLSGWTAAMAVSEEVLLDPLYRTLRWIGLLAALTVTLSFLLAFLYGRRIARFVSELTAATAALGRGEPVPAIAAPIREVTEAGEALAAAERELAARSAERDDLLATIGRSPAVVRDLDGHILFWGHGAEQLYGWSWAEADGRDVHELLATEFPRPLPEIQAALRASGFWEGEVRHRSKDNRILAVSSRWALRRDSATGAPLAVVETNSDVTALREAEAELRRLNQTLEQRVARAVSEREEALSALLQAQKMESIGQLTGGVAHDFNNLLNVVLLNLGLLKELLPPDPKLRRLLDGAVLGAERGATLTQRLLAFARRQELRPDNVDIRHLVQGASDLLRRSLGPTCQIVTEFAPNLPAVVVDPNQLELALVNLAVNARDAMPGGGTITVSATPAPVTDASPIHGLEPGEYVRLAVKDTGAGMDEATLARAVEPFFTTKGVGNGTGLGLSMVHGLAAQSGGTMRITSRPGAGSTVELWLRATQQRPTVAAAVEPAPEDRSGAATILVVDDDSLVRMGAAAVLENAGHTALEASSAPEALELLRSGARPDVILTDYAMPDLNGAQFAQIVQREWRLPVILASGYAELPEDLAPNVPRLNKPYRPEQLIAAVAAELRARGTQEPGRGTVPGAHCAEPG